MQVYLKRNDLAGCGEIWATCTRNELREDIDPGWWLCCQESPLKTLLSRIRIEDFCCLESADRKSIWQRNPHWLLLHCLQFLKDFLLQYFTLVLASVHLRQMTARKYQQFLSWQSVNSKSCNIFFHFQLLAVQDKCAVYMVGDRGAKCIKFP